MREEQAKKEDKQVDKEENKLTDGGNANGVASGINEKGP